MWESAGLPPPTAGLNLGGHRPHLESATVQPTHLDHYHSFPDC